LILLNNSDKLCAEQFWWVQRLVPARISDTGIWYGDYAQSPKVTGGSTLAQFCGWAELNFQLSILLKSRVLQKRVWNMAMLRGKEIGHSCILSFQRDALAIVRKVDMRTGYTPKRFQTKRFNVREFGFFYIAELASPTSSWHLNYRQAWLSGSSNEHLVPQCFEVPRWRRWRSLLHIAYMILSFLSIVP